MPDRKDQGDGEMVECTPRRTLLKLLGMGATTGSGLTLSSQPALADDSASSGDDGVILDQDFENISVGGYPNEWVKDGNQSQRVTDQYASSGARSLELRGSKGGCWQAVANAPLQFPDEGQLTIEFSFRPTTNGSFGCHSYRGLVNARTDAGWWSAGKGIGLLRFRSNGSVTAHGETVGDYSLNDWNNIRYSYTREDESISTEITVEPAGNLAASSVTIEREPTDFEDQLSYLTFRSGDFVNQVDEIKVTAGPSSPVVDIAQVRPVQVVFDTGLGDDDRLDLVNGKKTAVLVYPDGQNLEQLSGDIEIKLLGESEESDSALSGDSLDSDKPASINIDANKFQTKKENDGFFELFSTAVGIGNKEVLVQINSTDDEAEVAAEDSTYTVSVTNRSTQELELAYYRILSIGSIPADSEYDEFIQDANALITGTFPVAEDNFTGQDQGFLVGEIVPVPIVGVLNDLNELQFQSFAQTGSPYGVGVVDPTYFDIRGLPGSLGLTFPGLNSLIVSKDFPTATAHEMGHNFGLHTDTEEYYNNEGGMAGLDQTEGYWVSRKEYFESRIAFMEDASFLENISDRWIDNQPNEFSVDYADYDVIFESMLEDSNTLQQETLDAESTDQTEDVLYLKGLLYKDGSVDLSNWYYYQNKSSVDLEEGEYTVRARDEGGNVINEKSFRAPFELLTLEKGSNESPIQTNVAGFSFPVEFPNETRSLEFERDNEILKEVDPNLKLLEDAVDAIPDRAFRGPADDGRETLQSKVDKISQLIEKEQFSKAAKKLRQDLQPTAEEILRENLGRNCFSGMTDHYLSVAWWLPPDHQNEVQTDKIKFDLGLYAEQCRHNDGSGLSVGNTDQV